MTRIRKGAPIPAAVCTMLLVSVAAWPQEQSWKTTPEGITIDARLENLPTIGSGTLVRVDEGSILRVDEGHKALLSSDNGKTWESHTIFEDTSKFQTGATPAMVTTREGTIVIAFINSRERANWDWDPKISDSPGATLPLYTVRSLDGGKTWEEPVLLHKTWTGDVRDMIQTESGALAISTQRMEHDPGRHAVLCYVSKDEGATWKRSNVLDLGGVGHHGGVTEATIEQLEDGRIWMLMRTNWGHFWRVYSKDDGLSWHPYGPSTIEASSAPGYMTRLASGRLVLAWNRPRPADGSDWPKRGGDLQWSATPVSNYREELSIAFSDDDGETWTDPMVIAKKADTWIAYPKIFEAHPGELWVTTPQGGLHAKLHEEDFVD